MKDQCFLHSYIYNGNKNIYKFIKKRSMKNKKCLRLFNEKKNTFTCWTRLKTVKLLATAKQLIRKNSICCLKNQAIFFSQSERTDRLDHPVPSFVFVRFLMTPLPPPPQQTYFLNAPIAEVLF